MKKFNDTWKRRVYDWLRRKSFCFPVAYTDGTISRNKDFKSQKKPWGIVFKGCIIPLLDSPTKLTIEEAQSYCESLRFIGFECSLPEREWLIQLNKQVHRFNRLCKALGGHQLHSDYYFSGTAYGDKGYDVFMMDGKEVKNYKYANPEDRVWVRPIIKMSELYD